MGRGARKLMKNSSPGEKEKLIPILDDLRNGE